MVLDFEKLPVYENNCIVITENNLLKILYIFKADSRFKFRVLLDIVVIDIPHKKNRFIIKYLLLSMLRARLILSIEVNEFSKLESVTSIFSSSNWMEREVWDFFGIFFLNHNDLRHILLDYGFESFPLRKDYSLVGDRESFFNDKTKVVVQRPISLMQEYRNFYFSDNWEDWVVVENDGLESNFDLSREEFFDSLIELSVEATKEEGYFEYSARFFKFLWVFKKN